MLTIVSDFVDDVICSPGGLSVSRPRPSEVVHHDRGAPGGQVESIGLPQTYTMMLNLSAINYLLLEYFSFLDDFWCERNASK